MTNVYPEIVEKGPRAGKLRLRGIPGMKDFATLPDSPMRALLGIDGGNRLFAVAGGSVFEVFRDGTFTKMQGSVALGTNPALMVSNGFQLAIASAGSLYLVNGITGGGGAVTQLNFTDGTPIAAGTLDFLDQYFIINQVNSKAVFISNVAPAGATWDPGNTAIKEGYADNIARVFADNEQLWLFGFETTEAWVDTGALFPFQRFQGAVLKVGTDAPYSVAGALGRRFWLWRGVVYTAYGVDEERVSDYGVEEAIKTYGDVSNAEGFCQVTTGHLFYYLTFPTVGKCWVFDMTPNLRAWHERGYFNPLTGQFERYRARVYAKAFGKDLVGDPQTGKIYELDQNTYTDAGGVPLVRDRICPYITEDMANVRYNQLTLDMDTGVGLQVAPGQPGYDPQVMMRYSDDRGKNYKNWRQTTAGKIGEDTIRVIFNQNGSSRIGKVFHVRFTDPCEFAVNTAYLKLGQPLPGRGPA